METAKYIIDSGGIPIEKVFPIDGIREISGTIASCSDQSSGQWFSNTKDNVPLSLADYESKYPNNYNQIKKILLLPKMKKNQDLTLIIFMDGVRRMVNRKHQYNVMFINLLKIFYLLLMNINKK